jgi:hypothetical protein
LWRCAVPKIRKKSTLAVCAAVFSAFFSRFLPETIIELLYGFALLSSSLIHILEKTVSRSNGFAPLSLLTPLSLENRLTPGFMFFLPALRLSKLENTNACLPLFPLTQNQIPNKPFLLLMFSCRGPGVHNEECTKKIMMGGFVLWLLLTLFTKNHRRLPYDFVSPSSDLNLSKI